MTLGNEVSQRGVGLSEAAGTQTLRLRLRLEVVGPVVGALLIPFVVLAAKACVWPVARDASVDALAQLGEMRERGLVTEAELEGKKRELLVKV